MRLNATTAVTLAVVLAAIFGLAGWGHLLGLDPGALDAVRTCASALGALVLAGLGALLRRDDDRDGVPDLFQRLLGVIVIAFVAACASPQAALSTQATILAAHRAARVEYYEAQHAACLDASSDLAGYRACMRPARILQEAADTYRSALLAAQAALDAYGADGASHAIECAAEAARHLIEAAAAAHAPLPEGAEALARLPIGGSCGD